MRRGSQTKQHLLLCILLLPPLLFCSKITLDMFAMPTPSKFRYSEHMQSNKRSDRAMQINICMFKAALYVASNSCIRLEKSSIRQSILLVYMLHIENVVTSFTLLGNDLYLPFPAGTLLLTLWFRIDDAHSVYSIDYYTACAFIEMCTPCTYVFMPRVHGTKVVSFLNGFSVHILYAIFLCIYDV